jgi:ATP-binding cassette, subfamily C (CFTR/MRP), member 1
LLSAFASIQLTVLLARATNLNVATKASVAAAAVDFVAACALFILSCFEHTRSVTPSSIIGAYLLISLPFDAARLRTFYLLRTFAARSIANLLALSLSVKFGVLVTEAVEKRGILLAPYQDLPPEETSGIYNRSIFWWLNPLLRVGFGKNLNVEDLYTLDNAISSTNVKDRFVPRWTAIKDHSQLTLLWISIRILKWQLVTAALPRLILGAVRFAQPFLITATISYVNDRSNQPASTGWGLVGAYFLVYFTQGICTAAYQHLLNRALIQLRGGLISLLYEKTLDLSIATIDPASSLTLMSSDVQRIVDVGQMLHDTWPCIIEVGVAMFLLYRRLGSACYAPAIVYFIQAIGTGYITKVIPRFQGRWLEAAQGRVNFTSSLLYSMRNVKLLGLTSVIQDQTQGLRDFEVKECKAYRRVNNFMSM